MVSSNSPIIITAAPQAAVSTARTSTITNLSQEQVQSLVRSLGVVTATEGAAGEGMRIMMDSSSSPVIDSNARTATVVVANGSPDPDQQDQSIASRLKL